MAVKIVKQYEQGVLFRLGRVQGVRPPGLRLIVPFVDVLHRVSLRIITMPIQSQGIITRDNVSVDVSAVAYYRVVDAVKSVVAIENVRAAIDQIAQTTLRKVVGQHTLDETLSETDRINLDIREILDISTLDWGVEVTLVELKDIQLPDIDEAGDGPPGRSRAGEARQDHQRRGRVDGRRGSRAGLRHHDGPPARAPAAEPAEPGRDRRRQEHHRGLPRPADDHHRRTRVLPRPRSRRQHRLYTAGSRTAPRRGTAPGLATPSPTISANRYGRRPAHEAAGLAHTGAPGIVSAQREALHAGLRSHRQPTSTEAAS